MDRRVFCLILVAAWACVGQKQKAEIKSSDDWDDDDRIIDYPKSDVPADDTYWLRHTLHRLEHLIKRQERKLEQVLTQVQSLNQTHQAYLTSLG